MNDLTTKRITKLIKSATNVRNARNDAQRDAARNFMIQRARELCNRRDELLQKIEDGWYWLESYQVNDPAVAKQEQMFHAWNDELRHITDALDEAAETWTQPVEQEVAA